MSNQQDSGAYTKGFVFGAMIGGAVGALTALLLAPKSGKELRQDIADKSLDMYDKASDYMADVQENVGNKVNDTYNEGRIKAESIISNAKRQARELLNDAEGILSEAKDKAYATKDNVQDKIETLKEATKAGAEAFKAEINADKDVY